jgi:hypothetical protein
MTLKWVWQELMQEADMVGIIAANFEVLVCSWPGGEYFKYEILDHFLQATFCSSDSEPATTISVRYQLFKYLSSFNHKQIIVALSEPFLRPDSSPVPRR